MTSLMKRFVNDESGATAIEYGLIAGFVSVAIIAGLTSIRTDIQTVFGEIAEALGTAATPTPTP
jgi:pilus assembly protein Flp/PilA